MVSWFLLGQTQKAPLDNVPPCITLFHLRGISLPNKGDPLSLSLEQTGYFYYSALAYVVFQTSVVFLHYFTIVKARAAILFPKESGCQKNPGEVIGKTSQ